MTETEMTLPSVGRVWAFRAQAEAVAAARFGRLAGELAGLGAEPAVINMTFQAAEDEKLHEGLCSELAERYGYRGEPPQGEDHPGVWPSEMPFRDRVLFEVVAQCCITESLNVGLLTALSESARAPRIRKTTQQILRDEVRHSRIGWAHLAAERSRRDVRELAPFIPRMLAASVAEELFSPPPPGPKDLEAIEHGELPLQTRLEIFKTALQKVVFPGFEAAGIDASAARSWLKSKMGVIL